MANDSTNGISLSRRIGQNQQELNRSFEKLSSGKRINRASDDAAGLAIVASLESSVRTSGVASRNIQDAQSAIQIAGGALAQVSDIATRLKELATQASNGTLSDEQRGALQQEYGQLTQEINRIGGSTEFNGKSLLNGEEFSAQVGTDSSANSQIKIEGVDAASLSSGVQSTDISTQAGAQAALGQLDSLIANVAGAQAEFGAFESRLSTASNSVASRRENEEIAASRIRDVDVAEEVARKTASEIKLQVSSALAAQTGNLNATVVGRLLS